MIVPVFFSAFCMLITTKFNKNVKFNALLALLIVAALNFYYGVIDSNTAALSIIGICIGGALAVWFNLDKTKGAN